MELTLDSISVLQLELSPLIVVSLSKVRAVRYAVRGRVGPLATPVQRPVRTKVLQSMDHWVSDANFLLTVFWVSWGGWLAPAAKKGQKILLETT